MKFFLRCALIISLVFFLGEIYTWFNPSRYAQFSPEILKSKSLQYEPTVFARHAFPQKVQSFVDKIWKTPVGFPIYHINDKGYRGFDFIAQKPEGLTRIIFYGGSAVFDLALTAQEHWPQKVQKILKQKSFHAVEAINAGVPGHASFDSFGRLYSEGHHYQPDYVVLYNTWNDLKIFSSDKSLLRRVNPYQVKDNPFHAYRNKIDRFIGERSLLYNVLRFRYLRWKLKPELEGSTAKEKLKKPKKVNINPQALAQFKLTLEMFVDCARNIGATPVLMTQARLLADDNAESESYRLRHAHNMLDHDFSAQGFQKADEIIRLVAHEKNVDLIDAAILMQEREDNFFFIDHVHLTFDGSDRLAEIVADYFSKELGEKDHEKARVPESQSH